MALGTKTGGRRRGTPNKATAEVRALALTHAPAAVAELARLAVNAESEAARVSAIGMLLDRAHGKALPGRLIKIDLPDTSSLEGITKALAAVVQSVARGSLAPVEASALCSVLETQRRAIELSDVETRLARLEAAHGASH